MIKKILVAHPGTQHAPRLAQELYRKGVLYKYFTGLSFGEAGLLRYLFPKSWVKRREIKNIPSSFLRLQPWLDLFQLVIRLGVNPRFIYLFRNKIFQHSVPSGYIRHSDAIIGFDTSSLILAKRARKQRTPFFIELTTPHPAEKDKLLETLKEKYPLWMETQKTLMDSEFLEDEEVHEAFHVVAPSQYVKDTYVRHGLAEDKISINPYGASVDDFRIKKYGPCERIRFLFLGSFTANKGVPFLLDAWKSINTNSAELILAGYGAIPDEVILPPNIRLLGRIEKNERQDLFHSSDVFICPSFYEGLALVQIEAAACGLPIIGTTNSGVSEIIQDGRSGFVIIPGEVDSLINKINWFIDHPESIERMGREARDRIHLFSWEAYAERWMEIIARHKDKVS